MKLRSLSHTDDLTGLLNRRGFLFAGKALMDSVHAQRQAVLMFFLDVDGLHEVNDMLGRVAGDAVLLRVAAILRGVFRKDDLLARLGGDEFAALTAELPHDDARETAGQLSEAVDRDNEDHLLPHLSLSVGYVRVKPSQLRPLNQMLLEADTAMYGQKLSKLLTIDGLVA